MTTDEQGETKASEARDGPSTRAKLIKLKTSAGETLDTLARRSGYWALSLLVTLFLPCLPVVIELFRHMHAQPETMFVTAAVLSIAFAMTVEHILYFALYIVLFLVNILIDLAPALEVRPHFDVYAVWLLVSVLLLHASERIWWHLVLDRRFPDTGIFLRGEP